MVLNKVILKNILICIKPEIVKYAIIILNILYIMNNSKINNYYDNLLNKIMNNKDHRMTNIRKVIYKNER